MKKENKTLEVIIEGNAFQIDKQYVSGAEIRALGKIAPDNELFLAIKEPWEDELIKDSDQVDLARPGIEHFFSPGRFTKMNY
ncbi:MAG: multiubiquitin domain-containing protein [Bacteroidetes bacterium]|nr:multiubiquitin domain-containing protein [Bacteroidota bacterium]